MQNYLTKIQNAKTNEESLKLQLEYLKSQGIKVVKINTLLVVDRTTLPIEATVEVERIKGGWQCCESHSKNNFKTLCEDGKLVKANLNKEQANMLRLAFDGKGHTICLVQPASITKEMNNVRISMVGKHRTESTKSEEVEVAATA